MWWSHRPHKDLHRVQTCMTCIVQLGNRTGEVLVKWCCTVLLTQARPTMFYIYTSMYSINRHMYVLRLNHNISPLVCTCILLHCVCVCVHNVVRASSCYIQMCTECSLIPRPCALVACSTKFRMNFVLQAMNAQGLGTKLHWMHMCPECRCVLNADVHWMQMCTECRCVLNADVYWMQTCSVSRFISLSFLELSNSLGSVPNGSWQRVFWGTILPWAHAHEWVTISVQEIWIVTHVHQSVSFPHSHTPPLLISVRSDERWSVRV